MAANVHSIAVASAPAHTIVALLLAKVQCSYSAGLLLHTFLCVLSGRCELIAMYARLSLNYPSSITRYPLAFTIRDGLVSQTI